MHKKREKKRKFDGENGFEKWGGYMNAKISKLEAQFNEEKILISDQDGRVSDIFKGISIFVNGYTEPSADELRCLMLEHGGTYHHYYRSGKTTHIIASSLPNAKFDQMKSLKVVKCEWITESIKAGRLLNYKNFLLQNDFPNTKKENLLMKFTTMERTMLSKKESELAKTAADDGYLNEFYNNSRLHYISTLGAMLKQYVQDLRENHNGIFLGRQRLLENRKNATDSIVEQENFLDDTIIMHIDMDCFFVSVALRNHPHLKGQPVAVTHSKGKNPSIRGGVDRKFEAAYYKKKIESKIKPKDSSDDESDGAIEEWSKEVSSMSEIASCSYEARKAGVTKGMYLGSALKLCPNLKTVPYDFKGYKEVSMTLYNTVAEYTLDIEALSCDELIIDCTNLIEELKIAPLKFAEVLRQEIEEKTKCTSSVGIGRNKLQARLATKHAKPNGQFHLTPDKVEEFMEQLDIYDLPGVGRMVGGKLKSLRISTCGDLQKFHLTTLRKEFGGKTGETLYKYCRGIDERKVNLSYERKSVSAEVNYGIRFNDNEEAEAFLKQLSGEVSKRLKDVKMTGRNLTLKVKFRAKDAPVETAKFLGHGVCEEVNRSIGLPVASDDAAIIGKHVISLYHLLGIPPNELRGIGIQITKLENIKKTKTLQNYFSNSEENKSSKCESVQPREATIEVPPTSSQIDLEVLASLPSDIRLEVMKEYGLMHLMNEKSDNVKPNNGLSDLPKNRDCHPALEDERAKQDFFKLGLKELRIMIKEWVVAEHQPQSCDINLLTTYLTGLVEKKNLEGVSILMKCLQRNIKAEKKNSEVWQITYNGIVDSVQASMVKVFGKRLASEEV